jgi:hypothetical protein
MIHRPLIYRLSMLLSALFLSAGFMTASPPVVMKLLILAWNGNDGSYQSIARDLGQIGVPYDTVFVNNLTPDGSGNRLSGITLVDSANARGLYQGIVETDSSFNVCTNTCTSLLSAADVSKLNAYASQYAVRMVCYYGPPGAAWGLQAADSGATYTAASPLNVTLTPAGAAVFSYLNPAATIPVSGPALEPAGLIQGSSGIWAYRATPTAAAGETTTPLLMAGSYTVGATHTTADGRETLALTMDNFPAFLHSTAFSYGVINWVTKGVFLGSRRVYLGPEIDDLLLGNWLYAPALHPACESAGTCPTYFALAPDLQALVNWQANLKLDPLFGSFHHTFAYNGVGTTWFDPTDPIFSAIAASASQFTWVSHTWDHSNLDCYATNSKGNCIPATLAQSLAELNQNIAVAGKLGITLDKTDMVTPFNGGLTNPNFVKAAAQVGLKNIVYAGEPPSPQTGFFNTFAPSIFEITRRTPDLYWDVSTPLTGVAGSWTDEFNDEYGPGGTVPTFSQNQTYSQIIAIESDLIVRNNMLAYEPFPLAAHMDNMWLYDGKHSILSDLLNASIKEYENIFALPVLTLDLNTIAPLLQNRASYNASGVVGVYTSGLGVTLTTSKAAAIPVTGACSQPVCPSYGGQIQDSVSMAANSTATLSLTAPAGVSPASVSLNPASVTGGSSATGTVTLTGSAPAGGVSISLSSNSTAATVPAIVTIAAGSTTASFTVTTTAVTAAATATITASYNGVSKTAALGITASATAISSVSVNPASVSRGASSTGTVTLSGAAPSGGISVALSSNNTAATVPATVTVAAGSTTATFTVTTTAGTVAATATITASYNGVSKTAALTITAPAALSSVSLNPASVAGGTPSTGTVTLTSAAPSGGIAVALSSNNSSATVPATVTVTAGSTTATFTVTTTAVTSSVSATLTATYNGASKTAALSITSPGAVALSAVSVNPASVASLTSSTATVTLSGVAPTGGAAVSLSSNDASATVPASVTVAAGSTTASFTVTTHSVAYWTSVTIAAGYNGATKTAALTVTPLASVALSSVSVNPASVTTGTSTTGTVTLSVAAPAGGIAIELWTTGTVAYVPATMTIAAGSTTGTFTVTTNYTTSTLQDTVTAYYNGATKTATVTVTP